MKIEFNEKTEILFLKKQTEMIPEKKNSINQIKTSMESLTNRLSPVDDRTSRLLGKREE